MRTLELNTIKAYVEFKDEYAPFYHFSSFDHLFLLGTNKVIFNNLTLIKVHIDDYYERITKYSN